MSAFSINLLFCFLLGCIYSFCELLAKFRNARLILIIAWGWVYLIFNGFIAVLAFFILKDFNFVQSTYTSIEGKKILIAAGTSMVIIRSWIIAVPVGSDKKKNKKDSTENSLSPIIKIILSYVEREFDTARGAFYRDKINRIMLNVDFEKAFIAIPLTCNNMLVTLTADDGKDIVTRLTKISKTPVDNETKLLNLGLVMMDHINFGLLKVIVEKYKKQPDSDSPIDNLNGLIAEFNRA